MLLDTNCPVIHAAKRFSMPHAAVCRGTHGHSAGSLSEPDGSRSQVKNALANSSWPTCDKSRRACRLASRDGLQWYRCWPFSG
eukprot:2805537-Lingulodinium_polyedra.AAC.1